MVTAILDKSFDVYIRDFGVVKRVYCEVCVHCIFLAFARAFPRSVKLHFLMMI